MMNEGEFHIVQFEQVKFELSNRYKDAHFIGNGAQGFVCSAFDKELQKKVAIKKLDRPFSNPCQAKRTYREMKLMSMLSHPNIIKLLYVFSPQKTLHQFKDVYLVMDLMESSLDKVIRNYPSLLNHMDISHLMYQLLCGLQYLHKANIIHRDLKPSNIVIDKALNLKILDFGLARLSNSGGDSMTNYVVTRYYRSPEVLLGMNYGANVDIWSAGCIMGELVRGEVIFPGSDSFDQLNIIIELLGTPSDEFINKLRPYVSEYMMSLDHAIGLPIDKIFPDKCFLSKNSTKEYITLNTNQARDLLSKMLVIDPDQRVTIDQALEHPYFNIPINEQDETNIKYPTESYDDSLESDELTLDERKKIIYDEVCFYAHKNQHENLLNSLRKLIM